MPAGERDTVDDCATGDQARDRGLEDLVTVVDQRAVVDRGQHLAGRGGEVTFGQLVDLDAAVSQLRGDVEHRAVAHGGDWVAGAPAAVEVVHVVGQPGRTAVVADHLGGHAAGGGGPGRDDARARAVQGYVVGDHGAVLGGGQPEVVGLEPAPGLDGDQV